MDLRTCRPADRAALTALFYDAVHTACAGDYTPAQLDAWAPTPCDGALWARFFTADAALAAEEAGVLLGFGSLRDGELDLLFVRPDWQRRGVASVLCDFLERQCPDPTLRVQASRTARPFFAQRGYHLLRSQRISRRGQTLTNFLMEKELI